MTIPDQVRRRLDEPSERFWADEDIDDWCLEGAYEIARRTETLQDLIQLSVPAGTLEVALPADLLRIHLILWSTPAPGFVRFLPYVAPYSFRRDWRPGEPWCYTAWGTPPNLRFDRATTRDSYVYVAYYRTPVDLSDVPAGWEDLLVDYCEYQALRKDADPRHAEAKAFFETKLMQMVDTTRTWTDQAGNIDPTGLEFYFVPIIPTGPGWDFAQWDQDVWS